MEYVGSDAPAELVTALEPVAVGTTPDTLETSGYVVHTIQTALYGGLRADTAEDAIVTAVNRGGDADTIEAVTGAVAGGQFGASQVPGHWLAAVDETAEVERLADRLAELS